MNPRAVGSRLLVMIVASHGTAMLTGCPSENAKTGEPPATCVKAGDSCTFSPGKLGVCAEAADGRLALVCQSLH